MASGPRASFKNPVVNWIDERLPVFTLMQKEYGVFPTPKNFNYLWNFGAVAMVMLVVMLVTGIVLAMHYTPHADYAFDSVERIMRDVNSGWLLRYLHMNGASFFFIAVYIHIFRGMYYGSYKKPRELLWIFGVVIFLLMMATAFIGYTLPWSQMGGWAATVITNLFSAIPIFGDSIVTLLWGGYSVDNPTLNRFFALHYLLPFVIFAVVFLHVWALHVSGSNNPLGIDVKGPQDTLPFHPFYTMKDTFGLGVFLLFYVTVSFFAPNLFAHPDHFIEYNPMQTPAHIVPEWYFLPFYAILRAVTFDIGIPFTDIVFIEAKLGGVIAMFGAVIVLLFLPWLDTHPVRSARFRPLYRKFFALFCVAFLILGYVGAQLPEGIWVILGQACTAYYFGFFGLLIWLSRKEEALAVPNSISEEVLKKAAKAIAICAVSVALLTSGGPAARAAEAAHFDKQSWSFDGIFGTYDRAQLQRGFKVYREVCAACHSMDRVYYRNLADLGYDESQIKAIASEYMITDGPNDEGDMFERPGRPSDAFKSPYANRAAAMYANNGAFPPDMSLLSKARHGGPDYIYGILTGYKAPPEGTLLLQGQHWNKTMPGHIIAMAPPLQDGQVSFDDDAPQALDQYARDVAAFLTWAAEPHMESRKQIGITAFLFILVFTVLMYRVKKKLWSSHH